MIPQGSKIDLVIGDGFGDINMNVPDVIGMSVEEAMSILNGNGLTPTTIWDGPIDDSASAVIYSQTPSPYNETDAPNRIKEGDIIDLRIKQSPTNEELEGNRRPSPRVIKETNPETP
jgi:beta-lactam-binding protein with PASTA domain